MFVETNICHGAATVLERGDAETLEFHIYKRLYSSKSKGIHREARRHTRSTGKTNNTGRGRQVPLSHQGSSSAGSEPEPSFKPVLCFSTPKAPAPNQEKWFVSSTKTLLG